MSATAFAAQPPQRWRLWTLHGRLGRMAYIVCSLGAIVFCGLFILLASLGAMLTGSFGQTLYGIAGVLLFYCLLPVLFAVLTVRRAHDFNRGGWIALLLLVPLVNLVFWFMPGTSGDNVYGPAPQEPSAGMKFVAVLLPVLFIGGFLATADEGREPQARPAAQPATSLKPYQP